MKTIDININKAVLTSISLKFEEEELIVNASIDLYAGITKVSSFDIGTRHWRNESTFSLPISCINDANSLRSALEPIVVEKCMATLKQLPPAENNELS